jgi:hypothetical protein
LGSGHRAKDATVGASCSHFADDPVFVGPERPFVDVVTRDADDSLHELEARLAWLVDPAG